MPEHHLPDLTFPDLTYGSREVQRDLLRWIYSGGAGLHIKKVNASIKKGTLGQPLTERIELVRKIHEALSNAIARGVQRKTIFTQIEVLNNLFKWADETNVEVSLDSIEKEYRSWTDSLIHRVRIVRNLSAGSAYDFGSVAGWVIDRIFDRATAIVRSTRLKKPKRPTRAVGLQAEKQNLERTFAFGRFLLDLSDGLGVDKIWGTLPVLIPLRSGVVLEEWSGYSRVPRKLPNPKYPSQTSYHAKQSTLKRMRWEAEKTLRTRAPLINLRIQAEMFMLMGQPGVNLAQVIKLRMDQWRYKPSTNGYEIRTYKNRRWGPVVFEIHSAYRPIFERYLQWREAIFPDDPNGLLFPLLGKVGAPTTRHSDSPSGFHKLKRACAQGGIVYIPPTALRSTNVNWMLRRTQDPSLTAEEKQHSVKTLLNVYEKPSLHRAQGQIKKFWAKHDPSKAAAGPGLCHGGFAAPINDIPAAAPVPNCLTPAGCLFCTNQRDIDSQDHVWSLVSFRELRSFELSRQGASDSDKSRQEHPAEVVIARVNAKLDYISASSPRRDEWVKEAFLRMTEGRYHPSWGPLIESF